MDGSVIRPTNAVAAHSGKLSNLSQTINANNKNINRRVDPTVSRCEIGKPTQKS